MDPEPSPSTTTDAPETDRRSSTAVNALIGAVAGIVLSFIPLSTLLGGAVAGYLEGGDTNDGLRVGAIAGLIMLVPFVLIGLFFVTFLLGVGPGGPPLAFGMMAVFMLVVGALYTIGLSAIGGYLGVYLKYEL
ncbi:DUF5518 domain-containing protein [Halosolutus halophilus]|uniref:DUF5518 domain-containing protein n=1 Tax=Halosolutus halophilus TaxID=1552990 RepID=UPI002235231C|nr:DUF5518 domain-containing protein [Halosolutus halophilus]